jgi:hypothetical protein
MIDRYWALASSQSTNDIHLLHCHQEYPLTQSHRSISSNHYMPGTIVSFLQTQQKSTSARQQARTFPSNDTNTTSSSRTYNYNYKRFPLVQVVWMNSTIAALCVWTALDYLWCLTLLFRLLFTTNVPRRGYDDSSADCQSQSVHGLWVLRDAISVARPFRGCRYPVQVNHLALAHDLESAGVHEKRPFGAASLEDSGPQVRRGGLPWLRLLRGFTGVLLLSPACMLVMSNYAVTRGLLQNCSRFEPLPFGVSRHPDSFFVFC